MSEPIENTPAEQAPAEGASQEQQQEETFSREYVEKLRRENASYRTTAKEAEKARLSTMSEAERSVAEAEARGRTAAATEFGKRLARTEFDAAAARRNAEYDTAGALEYVDLARFVGDDGEPDLKAIAAAVERLIPAPTGTPQAIPSFDGGPRQTATKPASMSDLIRGAVNGTR